MDLVPVPRRKNPAPSLTLGEWAKVPPPTRERAFELVKRIPLGTPLRKRLNACGGSCCKRGPTHGPYWFARISDRADRRGGTRYVGSDESKRELELAWELVAAELAAREDDPGVRRLRELEAIAGVKKAWAPAGLVVPITSTGGRSEPPK